MKKIISFLSVLVLTILLIISLVLYGPEKIVNSIGVENSYLVLFLFAIFGGVSAFTSLTFYSVVGAFYFAGLNFFVLILIGATGLTIGDSVFYYLGKKGHEAIKTTSHKKKIAHLEKFIKKMPSKLVFLFILIYAGIFPFPKDILCVALGISDFPYKKFVLPFFLGNLLFNFLFLILLSQGINFLFF